MKRTIGVGSLTALVWLLSAGQALAQNTDGAFRLSLDGILYAGEFGTLVAPADPEFGELELETTTTNAGLYAGSFGVGLAYAFSPNGVIGARLLHSSSTSNIAGDTVPATSNTHFTLLPYGEYVFMGGSTVQPFVSGSIGLQTGSSEAGEIENSSSAFVLGFSAGLHLFPTDTFSIDPYFAFYRATGSATLGSIEVDYGSSTWLLGFSISGWIGGTREGAPEAEDAPQPDAVAETRIYEATAAREPEPEPEPPAANGAMKLEEEGGVLSAAVALGSGQLTLIGRPMVDGRNILVRLAVSGRESALKDCGTGALISGGNRVALRDLAVRERAHGSSTIIVLQGKVSPEELSAFTEADDSRIVLCGRIFAVHSQQRQDIGGYFEQFKTRAMEANTWGTAAAPPSSEAQSVPPDASEAPAPSAPPATVPAPPPAPAKPAPNTKKAPASTPPAPPPSGSAPPTGSFETP
jgi:hypothetical protein